MPQRSVVLDANILFSETTTAVFVALGHAGLVRLHWSARIHDEWMRAIARALPTTPAQAIVNRRIALDAAFPQASVIVDDARLAALQLPDRNDRHVLAAAIAARADVIVTANLGDFPKARLAPHGVIAQTADAFLLQLLQADPPCVSAALGSIPRDLDKLRRANLRRFAKALACHIAAQKD